MRPTMRVMALALVTCAVFGSSAYASDAKVMAGAACQPRLPGDRDDIAVLFDGATNIDDDVTDPTAFVLCPIVRDNTPSPTRAGYCNMRTLEGGRL
jgi:hypothetical protein